MLDFSRFLGDAVKTARLELGLTQREVAERAEIDTRTILNIENYKGNPKTEVLFPLIRTLKLDPRKIFYPELQGERSLAVDRLLLLLSDCTEQEALALTSVIESILAAFREKTCERIQ